ncbi:MAG: enoyl-CoA hydratase-related protein [Acidimicrobiales bacterium]
MTAVRGDEPGHLRVDREGAVLVVTLDRPDKRNAYDGPTLKALGTVWADLDDDPALRAGVITGAGGTFCAGADVAAAAGGGFSDPPYPEVAEGLATKPVIAAIEGLCLGGGMMIATGADLRIGGAGATFGLPEARWNLPAQWLGALARQVLPAHALELALLADERLPAARLHEMGWLNRVVDDGTALDAALAWADRLAALAPRALRHSKALVRAGTWMDPDDALALGHRHAAELVHMHDTVEGGTAFAERRPPRFEDR